MQPYAAIVVLSDAGVKRSFARFVGVDLGGGRGKTTAVAEIRTSTGGGAEVVEVATRRGDQRWNDDALVNYIAGLSLDAVVAIDAPLTQTACGRCERPLCPGVERCADPAVEWLRTVGRQLVEAVAAEAAVEGSVTIGRRRHHVQQVRLAPYAHRATDVMLTYRRELLPISSLSANTSAVAARATWIAKRLRVSGYQLHQNLIEVSPAATIAALCDPLLARSYKHDADPWWTRATILEKITDLSFAPQSRMAREDVLGNDHCFDAVISAYTAFLWARDGWEPPEGVFCDDGWIVTPP